MFNVLVFTCESFDVLSHVSVIVLDVIVWSHVSVIVFDVVILSHVSVMMCSIVVLSHVFHDFLTCTCDYHMDFCTYRLMFSLVYMLCFVPLQLKL